MGSHLSAPQLGRLVVSDRAAAPRGWDKTSRRNGFRLPRFFIPDDSVKNGQKLSCHRDQRHHFWFSGSDKTVVETLQRGIASFCRHRRHEQYGAHGSASSGDETPAAPFSGLARERSKTDETCDLPPIECAKFGNFGEERSRGDGTHARNAGEKIFLFAPNGRVSEH